MASEKMKWDILKNAKKLKEVKTGDLKDIFIVPDKTFQEREEYRALKQLLNYKINRGERGWYIRGGKLHNKFQDPSGNTE